MAKAFEAEPPVTDISQSPTLTEEMTRAGVILGTAAYMSPEQTKGKPVDKRADIFAFGSVLYELLTGKRAFEGETITETIAKVLESEPKWELLPENTPWTIRTLLRRCLTKDPHDRLDGIANVRVEIKLTLEEPTTVSPIGVTTVQAPLWKRTLPWIVTAVVILIAGMSIWTSTRPTQESPRRFVVSPSPDRSLADASGRDIAISPDGNHIVYVAEIEGTTQLYLRSLDEFTATPIAGTEGATYPFFLPDSHSLVFVADDRLKRISVTGGSPTTLCEVTAFRGGSWVPGEAIVFSAGAGSGGALYLVSATGGEPQILAVPDTGKGERFYQNPTTLPDGKTVLFIISGIESFVAALSLETGELKILREGGPKVAYASTGHLIYGSDGVLMAVPFDPEKLVEIGEPGLVVEGLRSTTNTDFSSDGTLIYVPGESNTPNSRLLASVDFAGNATPHRQMQTFEQPRVSPDGRKVAFTITGPPYARSGAWGDLFTYDLESDTLSRLTFDGFSHTVIWSSDGKWLTFESSRNGPANIFRTPADGSGEVEELVGGPNAQWPSSFSPDGQVMVYTESDPSTDLDIWTVSVNGDSNPQPFLQTPAIEWGAIFSPDGKWIAYTSDELGSQEIYVRPF